MLSFMGYQNCFLSIVHGIFNGIFIEGASRFGLEAIWQYPKKVESQGPSKTYAEEDDAELKSSLYI